VRKLLAYSIVSLVAFFLLALLVRRVHVKKNSVISIAIIENAGFRMQKDGSWSLLYAFVDSEGDTIRSKTDFFLRISLKDSLIGRTVPCAYYKNNSKISELLIYEHTWKQYGLVYPDSMKWTKRFFKDIIYSY